MQIDKKYNRISLILFNDQEDYEDSINQELYRLESKYPSFELLDIKFVVTETNINFSSSVLIIYKYLKEEDEVKKEWKNIMY